MSNYKYMHFWMDKGGSYHTTHIMFRNKPIKNWGDWSDWGVEPHRLDGPAIILIDSKIHTYIEYGEKLKTEAW